MRRPQLLFLLLSVLLGACGGDTTEPARLASVVVTCGAPSVQVSGTVQCAAAARDQREQAMSGATFTWSTSDATVATVDASGLVTALKAGTAIVTATAAGSTISGSATLTVPAPPVVVHQGTIATSETWSANATHRVVGSLMIEGAAAPVVTIAAGTVVEFADDAILYVGGGNSGALRAMGTTAQPITFRAASTTPVKGAWQRVSFQTSTVQSELHHVSVSGCGQAANPALSGCLEILGGTTRPVLDHVTVTNSASNGVFASLGGGFGAGSASLVVSAANRMPVSIGANTAGTIPRPAEALAAPGPFGGNATNKIEVRTEDVSATQTWANLGVPYLITDGIWVRSGSATATTTLTIAPGTTIRFGTLGYLQFGLSSAGVLKAEGTPTQPILFTSDAATPTTGAWGSIAFSDLSAGSRLAHATLEYCGGADANSAADACLVILGNSTVASTARPEVDTVRIRRAGGYGVFADLDGAFHAGSSHLTIEDGASFPIFIQPDWAGSIPTGGTFAGNATNMIRLKDGDVTRTQTWPNLGIPYSVDWHVQVLRSQLRSNEIPTLTLLPGTTVRFDQDGYFWVGNMEGALVAVGTATAPITFTGSTATPGWWGGLVFLRNRTTATRLEHVVVEYGGGENQTGFTKGNIVVDWDHGAFISNSVIRNSSVCGIVRYTDSGLPFTTDFTSGLGNTFTANAAGAQCGP